MTQPVPRAFAYTLDDVYELVQKIPAVLACRIIEEDDAVREMHVLSTDSRSPKQIARDIQSALLARFSLSVDHRYISIAQIPGELTSETAAPSVPARLVTTRLALSLDQTAVDATVTLALGDRIAEATERGDKYGSDRRRAVARATVGAINSFLGQSEKLHLVELSELTIAGKAVQLAAILYEENTRREDLVGAAYDRGNTDDAVIHAVLDAVNRKLRF